MDTTLIERAMAQLGNVITQKQELTDMSAEVLVNDPQAFLKRLPLAEAYVGRRVECDVLRGTGSCILRVTEERVERLSHLRGQR